MHAKTEKQKRAPSLKVCPSNQKRQAPANQTTAMSAGGGKKTL